MACIIMGLGYLEGKDTLDNAASSNGLSITVLKHFRCLQCNMVQKNRTIWSRDTTKSTEPKPATLHELGDDGQSHPQGPCRRNLIFNKGCLKPLIETWISTYLMESQNCLGWKESLKAI